VNRTQIYLDEQQTTRLDERAAGEGVSRSTVIRRAVDQYLARDQQDSSAWRQRWREAVAKTAGIARDLPEGADYVEQLRAADAERLRELER
jgi:metal-responsive CopG/Arc/MetJ family transcriptional regulator